MSSIERCVLHIRGNILTEEMKRDVNETERENTGL